MSGASDSAGAAGITDLPTLLAHAYAIEVEAEERYTELADQMEVHNNLEVAAVFRKLARVEGLHAAQIKERAGDTELPHIPPWEYAWGSGESPEAGEVLEAHYLMTPHHALTLALHAEQRAFEFFDRLQKTAANEELRAMAAEFAEEEREHVQLVEELLARHPKPAKDWDEDLDPPMLQE